MPLLEIVEKMIQKIQSLIHNLQKNTIIFLSSAFFVFLTFTHLLSSTANIQILFIFSFLAQCLPASVSQLITLLNRNRFNKKHTTLHNKQISYV